MAIYQSTVTEDPLAPCHSGHIPYYTNPW